MRLDGERPLDRRHLAEVDDEGDGVEYDVEGTGGGPGQNPALSGPTAGGQWVRGSSRKCKLPIRCSTALEVEHVSVLDLSACDVDARSREQLRGGLRVWAEWSLLSPGVPKAHRAGAPALTFMEDVSAADAGM